jgi:outer membrane protein
VTEYYKKKENFGGKMKKTIIIIGMLLMSALMFAQVKLAYVDTEKVIESYKKAETAKAELETEFKKWETKLKEMDEELKGLVDSYEAQKTMLTAEMKKSKQEEITTKQQEAQNLYMEVMGDRGIMKQRQMELMQPLFEDIENKIQEVREREGYSMIFDKTTSGLIDADESLDITDMIIEELNK